MKEEWFLMISHKVKMVVNDSVFQSVKGGRAHA